MSDLHSPHDSLFRFMMSNREVAVEYFRNFLPASVSERLDFDTLTQLSDVYISEDLKKYMSDLVYMCKVKGSDTEVRVSLLIEHKSYADNSVPVQIGNYIYSGYLKQLQNEGKLSLIIPVLLYHGPDIWEYQTLKTLFPVLHPEWHRFLPDFEYIYHNLGEVSDDTIALLRKGSLQELIFLLKYAHNALKLSDHLVELLKNPPFSFTSPEMRVIVKYLIHQSKMGRNKIIEIMETVPEEKKDDLMSIAEYLQEKVFERGVEKGIEQGIEKGIKKGIEQGVKQGVKRGMELGREEARNEKNHTAAVNMIRRGYSDTEVSEVLEVSLDYVRSIRKSLQQNP